MSESYLPMIINTKNNHHEAVQICEYSGVSWKNIILITDISTVVCKAAALDGYIEVTLKMTQL